MTVRILEAATDLFMQQGYEGTSYEQIATVARAGKATIYARYANKEALFSAVIQFSVDRSLDLAEASVSAHGQETRPGDVLEALVTHMLSAHAVALTRIVVAEGARFPFLARLVDEVGRQRASQILIANLTTPGGRSSSDAAQLLLELTFVPLMLRALMGEDLDALRGEIERRVILATRTIGAIPGQQDE